MSSDFRLRARRRLKPSAAIVIAVARPVRECVRRRRAAAAVAAAGRGSRNARATGGLSGLPGGSLPGGGGLHRVRALGGPAPFVGSNAVAISPDGSNVYVASSRSNAIAIFTRDARTGKLTQASRARAGCIAARRRRRLRDTRVGSRRAELRRRQPGRQERLRDVASAAAPS